MKLPKSLHRKLNHWDKKHTKRINADLKRRGMAFLIPTNQSFTKWTKQINVKER